MSVAKGDTTPGIAIGTRGPGVEVALPEGGGLTLALDLALVTGPGVGPGITQGQEKEVVLETGLDHAPAQEIAAVQEEVLDPGLNQEKGNVLDHMMRKETVADPDRQDKTVVQEKR